MGIVIHLGLPKTLGSQTQRSFCVRPLCIPHAGEPGIASEDLGSNG